MRKKALTILWAICILLANACAWGQDTGNPDSAAPAGATSSDTVVGPIELLRYKDEFSSVRIEPARLGSKAGIAVIFEGTEDLHYYAKAETAPAEGLELKIEAKSDSLIFSEATFPKWGILKDPLGKSIEVYAGKFAVFVPIESTTAAQADTVEHVDVEVNISGIACTSKVCLPPFEKTLRTKVNWSQRDSWKQVTPRRSADVISTDVVTISLELQHDAVKPGSESALAIHFELKKDWHFYASKETAPGGMNLKIKPEPVIDRTVLFIDETTLSSLLNFGEPIFPRPEVYFDKALGQKLEVFSNTFTVYIPFRAGPAAFDADSTFFRPGETSGFAHAVQIRIGIEGAVCSQMQCRMPDFGELSTQIRIDPTAPMSQPAFRLPGPEGIPPREPAKLAETTSVIGSAWSALLLAFVAGLALNIMPCVWPVLPIIIMRIVDQAKKGRRQSVMMGLAFCIGILLFFACLAGANIILQSFYDKTLSWGDHLRNPVIVTALALLMIVMALFMFGIFTITVPSSIASKSGSGKGYAGSLGMGFLAAILSTPCSFGILTVAFVWAQGQSLPLGTLAIMVIGLGMAVPYAILTSVPGWLNHLPRAGRWMELFKQTLGFVLLVIAIKLIKAVPQENKINLLYFAVVLSFGIWMWGTWVTYGTKVSRKLLVRGIAVLLVILASWFFFTPELVDWQDYDSALIESAKSEQKPVLIKFTADWCTNCEVVDRFVYQRKDIARLIDKKGVLAIKADTTETNQPATLDLKNIYNEPGVPVSILLLPGQPKPIRLRELFFNDELTELLENLPDKDSGT